MSLEESVSVSVCVDPAATALRIYAVAVICVWKVILLSIMFWCWGSTGAGARMQLLCMGAADAANQTPRPQHGLVL